MFVKIGWIHITLSISVVKSCWATMYRETASLLEQLETVRKEKHEVEEARAMAAKQRVQQIEELVSENGNLREEVRVLNERLKTQADELGQVRKEMSLVESSLFRANSEVSRIHESLSYLPPNFYVCRYCR